MTHPRLMTPRMSRRTMLRLGFGAGAAVLLSGCPGNGDEEAAQQVDDLEVGREYDGPPVNLAFWNGFTGGDGPFLRELVDQFNGEHDNIDVEMNTLQWEDFYASVPPAVTRGEGPDVAVMHLDQLGTNAARGVILPLDNIVDELELEADDFDPAVWEEGL
jgi:multiple sugar transport system substrate-binding protein